MSKGNNGNPDCQRRSNCCPGGIEEQEPVALIPGESSSKTEASESVNAKVELFELKSRASQEGHEKAKQPKKPINTASQEVPEKAEPPKKHVKKPLKRLSKKPLLKKAVVKKSEDKKVQKKSKTVQVEAEQKSNSTQTKGIEAKKNQPKKPKVKKAVVKKPEDKEVQKKSRSVQVEVKQKSKSAQTKGKEAKKRVQKKSKASQVAKKTAQPKKPREERPMQTDAAEKSEMDDKKAHIGDFSAKDLFKAIQFAAIKQKNQRSYMSEYKLPSINIDIAMANMLAKAGEKDKVLLQAIFLHDLVDWTNTSLDEIKEEFGSSVASVVEEVTSVDKGGKFDRELGGKASKGAVNSLSRNGKLIRLSDLLWQMTMLVEASEERDLTSWEKERIEGAKEEMAHYGEDTNIKILAALKKAMEILIQSSIM